MNTNTCGVIVTRLIGLEPGKLSRAAAQSLLQIDFPESDHARVAELSDKVQEGTLTDDERDELDEYIRVADMLAILQSKARRSIRRAQQVPNE